MSNFEKLYTEFENTRDVCDFYDKYDFDSTSTRFLLIRSLNKEGLKDIITSHSDKEPSGNFKELIKTAYESQVTIPQLLQYIEGKRNTLIVARREELEGLPELLSEFPVVNCGVRNDKVDDIVKSFVRNKSIKNIDELLHELDDSVLPKIRQYSMWSYYNQTSNDVIELFFLKHASVIPTLRKIHDIDFFIKLENKIIPFDLKFTHISESYFDLASQGIIPSKSGDDDFYIAEDKESELKTIRKYYQGFRKSNTHLHLEAASKLSKAEIIELISEYGNEDEKRFVADIQKAHKEYVPKTSEELKTLEWWNYKYQGERLFCNNNRLFVFLAFTDRFVDGRELKGKTREISTKIKQMLDTLSSETIHDINYYYDKEAGLEKAYHAKSLSTIYFE